MHLDHFVIHVDDKSVPANIAEAANSAGFPFNPNKGKGTKGFKATNIWMGREYFEITWLLKKDGGGWIPEWVERYNKGARGLTCLFLRTNELDKLENDFLQREIEHRVERTSFKVLWGLYTVKLPWRILLLPPIPGTDMEISFIEYDKGAIEKYSKYWKPNSTENGITSINSATIRVPNLQEAKLFLKTLFPNLKSTSSDIQIPVEDGLIKVIQEEGKRATFFAKSKAPVSDTRTFSIEDVEVQVVH